MKQAEPASLIQRLALHCAACAGVGAGFGGALLALDVGGLGTLVASAQTPLAVLIVLFAGQLSLLPMAFLTAVGGARESDD